MNKSKFLKKSLALLLAFMLVFAMIPVGASAVGESFSKVEVTYGVNSSSEAKLENSTWTAEVPEGTDTFGIKVTLLDNGGVPYYVDDDGNPQPLTAANGVYSATGLNAGDYPDGVTLRIYDKPLGDLMKEYTLTLKEVGADTDNTVHAFTVAGQYNDADIVTSDAPNGKNTISAVVPYGVTGTITASVTVADTSIVAVSGIDGSASSSGGGKFTFDIDASDELNQDFSLKVTSQSGAVRDYAVTIKTASLFTSFSVKGEAKDATIEVNGSGTAAPKEVFVNMPYGTKTDSNSSYKFTPEYKLVYPSVKVEAYKTGSSTETVAFESGKEIDLKDIATTTLAGSGISIDGAKVKLKVTYNSGETEDWIVNFVVPTQNPNAEITALRIGNFTGTINGRDITVNYAGAVSTHSLDIEGSENAGLLVVGTGTTGTLTAGKLTLANVDCSKKVTLRVTSEAKESDNTTPVKTTDYYLTVNSTAPVEPKITSMTLQDPDGNNRPTAQINDAAGTITLSVPYSVATRTDLANWKLFYTLSNGAEANLDKPTGDKVSQFTQSFFPGSFDGKAKGTNITVTAKTASGNLATKNYNIIITRDAARLGHTLSNLTVSPEDEYSNLTDKNQYSAKPDSKKAITIKVPYSDYEAITDVVYSIPTMDPGAELYLMASDGSATHVQPITETANGSPAIDLADCTGATDNDVVKLLVVSEKAYIDSNKIASITDVADFKTANPASFTEYTLVIKENDPRTTANLDSISLRGGADVDRRVTAEINRSQNLVTFNVPASLAAETTIYMPFTVSAGEAVYWLVQDQAADDAKNNLVGVAYKEKSDGSVDSGASTAFKIVNGELQTTHLTQDYTVVGLSVRCEAYDATAPFTASTNLKHYTFKVNVLPPEKDSKMTSFSINGSTGTIKDNEITVNLPFGSEITSLKANFTTSKNAVVKNSGNSVLSGKTSINYTNPVTLQVLAEDGSYTNYTVTVKVSDEFSDVPKTAWYYEEVMKAVRLGLITGKGSGIFAPMEDVKRGDFALMIARMENGGEEGWKKVESNYTEAKFPDVSSNDYYFEAVNYCAEKGYIDGNSDGTFNAKRTIKREEMAKLLCRVAELSEVTSPANKFADDASISNWAKGYVYAASEAGLMNGIGNNKFAPKSTTPRCQAAAALVRYTESK